MNVFSTALTLYLIMNSIGNVPVFMSMLKHVEPKRRKWVLIRETSFACCFLIAFLFGGRSICEALQVSQQALNIAGGIIVFIIALKLIFPPEKNNDEATGEPFIVPMAIPFIAGPSSLVFVTLSAGQHPNHLLGLLISVFIASGASLITFLMSEPIRAVLGEKLLIALERLTGMMLTTIAVQMLLIGIVEFWQHASYNH